MSAPPVFTAAVRPSPGAVLPGLGLAGGLALAASLAGQVQGLVPPAVIAVLLGMLTLPLVQAGRLAPGLKLSTGPLLRIAVALLGLRLSLLDVAGIGVIRVLALILAMLATILVCRALARALGLGAGAGLVMGAANAICGAAAAFAMAAALPERERERRILILSVVMANAISTLAMVAYPALANQLGFSPAETGALIGAAVQDMAQVVATTAPLPPEAARAGITLKMLRVLMLLPLVVLFTRPLGQPGETPAVPRFALWFLALCLLNTGLEAAPGAMPFYAPLRAALGQLSGALLLLALAAMGLSTTLRVLLEGGWRPLALFGVGALTILLGGLLIARYL